MKWSAQHGQGGMDGRPAGGLGERHAHVSMTQHRALLNSFVLPPWSGTDRWAPPAAFAGNADVGAGRGRPVPMVREKEPWPDASAKQRPVASERWTGEGVSFVGNFKECDD